MKSIPAHSQFSPLVRFVLTGQALCLLLMSAVTWVIAGPDQAFAFAMGGVSAMVPFALFAAVLLIGYHPAKRARMMGCFFAGVFLKFVLSAALLWLFCLHWSQPLLVTLSGFVLTYLSLLILPRRRIYAASARRAT